LLLNEGGMDPSAAYEDGMEMTNLAGDCTLRLNCP